MWCSYLFYHPPHPRLHPGYHCIYGIHFQEACGAQKKIFFYLDFKMKKKDQKPSKHPSRDRVKIISLKLDSSHVSPSIEFSNLLSNHPSEGRGLVNETICGILTLSLLGFCSKSNTLRKTQKKVLKMKRFKKSNFCVV